MSSLLIKICKNCGREITWRKKWERNWATIAYCSVSCKRPLGALDRAFETGILALLSARRIEAVAGHRKGGAVLASCMVEEVEAIVLATWKEEGRRVDGGSSLGGGSDDEGARSDDEGTPVKGSQRSVSPARSVSPSPSPSIADTSTTGTSRSTSPAPGTPRSKPSFTRERCRKAARRLVDYKLIEIWQKGNVVNPSFAKGPLELRGVAGLPTVLAMENREVDGIAEEQDEEELDPRKSSKKKAVVEIDMQSEQKKLGRGKPKRRTNNF